MSLEEEGVTIITELNGDGYEAYLNRKQDLFNRSMALPLSHFWSCKGDKPLAECMCVKPPPYWKCSKCLGNHWPSLCNFAGTNLKRTTGLPRSFFRPSDRDVPGARINSNGQVVISEMEEQAYSQATTREPIQVIDIDGWRASVGQYNNLGDGFDWTQHKKEEKDQAMPPKGLSIWPENTQRKRRLSVSSNDDGVEIKRRHNSRHNRDNSGQPCTFYETGQNSERVEAQSYPFEDRRSRTYVPNRSSYGYMEAKLICSNNFEAEARRLLEAPLTSQRRSRSRQREISRSRSRSGSLERSRSNRQDICITTRQSKTRSKNERSDFRSKEGNHLNRVGKGEENSLCRNKKNSEHQSTNLSKRSNSQTSSTIIGTSSDIEEGEIVSDDENDIASPKTDEAIQTILGVVKQERIHSSCTVSEVKCEIMESSSTPTEKENTALLLTCKKEYIEPDDIIKLEPIVKSEFQKHAYSLPSQIEQDNQEKSTKAYEEIDDKEQRAKIKAGMTTLEWMPDMEKFANMYLDFKNSVKEQADINEGDELLMQISQLDCQNPDVLVSLIEEFWSDSHTKETWTEIFSEKFPIIRTGTISEFNLILDILLLAHQNMRTQLPAEERDSPCQDPVQNDNNIEQLSQDPSKSYQVISNPVVGHPVASTPGSNLLSAESTNAPQDNQSLVKQENLDNNQYLSNHEENNNSVKASQTESVSSENSLVDTQKTKRDHSKVEEIEIKMEIEKEGEEDIYHTKLFQQRLLSIYLDKSEMAPKKTCVSIKKKDVGRVKGKGTVKCVYPATQDAKKDVLARQSITSKKTEPTTPSQKNKLRCRHLFQKHIKPPGLCMFRDKGCTNLDCRFAHKLPDHLSLPSYCADYMESSNHCLEGTRKREECLGKHHTISHIPYSDLNQIYFRKLKEILDYCDLCNTEDAENIPTQTNSLMKPPSLTKPPTLTKYPSLMKPPSPIEPNCHGLAEFLAGAGSATFIKPALSHETDYEKLLRETKETIVAEREFQNQEALKNYLTNYLEHVENTISFPALLKNYKNMFKRHLSLTEFGFKKGQLEKLIISLNFVVCNTIIRLKQNTTRKYESEEGIQSSKKPQNGQEGNLKEQSSNGEELEALQYEENSSEDKDEIRKESDQTFALTHDVKHSNIEQQDTTAVKTTSVKFSTSKNYENVKRRIIIYDIMNNSKKVKEVDNNEASIHQKEKVPPSEFGCLTLLSPHLTSPGLCRFREVGCKRLDCLFTHRLPDHLNLPVYCSDCSLVDILDKTHDTRPTCIPYPKLNAIYKEKLKDIQHFCHDCQAQRSIHAEMNNTALNDKKSKLTIPYTNIAIFEEESPEKNKVVNARIQRTTLQTLASSPINVHEDIEKPDVEQPRKSNIHNRLGEPEICWHFHQNRYCRYGNKCDFIH